MKHFAQILCLSALLYSCDKDTTESEKLNCVDTYSGSYECQVQKYEVHMGTTVQDTILTDTLVVIEENNQISISSWTFALDSVCQNDEYSISDYQIERHVKFWGDSIDFYYSNSGLGGYGWSQFFGKKL